VKKIGLTGSIGAGKSAASDWLRAHGVAVHDADAAVHEIYRWPEMVVWFAYHFPGVMKSGELDRAKLADLIFENPVLKTKLESIIHPAVADHRANFITAAAARGETMAVCDIPLLFETGAEKELDEVWLIAAPLEVRRARVVLREGMTAEKFDRINAAQMDENEKRSYADVVIENDGTLEQLHEKLAWLIGRK